MTIKLPRVNGGYSVIYADPPWHFAAWSHRGEKKSAVQHYDCMNLSDLCALPVSSIAAEDAALFIWVVQPQLPEALDVMTSWGFTFRTVAFAWVKMKPRWIGYGFTEPITQPRLGLGYHTRSEFEQCWLGIRGKGYKRMSKNVEQVLYAPLREHSRKPDQFYDRIEALTGDVPKIELFARQQRKGWDTWGNEVGKFRRKP